MLEITKAPAAYAGAVVRAITEIKVHPNADRLEIAMLGKFQTVVPKGRYAAGQLVIFIEADTVLPTHMQWSEEYEKYAPKRVKIVKLRDVFSEGIVAPLDTLLSVGWRESDIHAGCAGLDVSAYLQTTHYSPPIQEPGAIGPLPAFLPKTDEERWEKIVGQPEGVPHYTLKIDGTSVTFLPDVAGDRWRVFGRTLEYPADPSNKMGALLAKYQDSLRTLLDNLPGGGWASSYALRGEAYGQGIQGNAKNPHSRIEGRHWALYGVYDVDERRYLDFDVVKSAAVAAGVPTVTSYEWGPLTDALIERIQNGTAIVQPYEGIVVKYPDGSSFKILNKSYDAAK